MAANSAEIRAKRLAKLGANTDRPRTSSPGEAAPSATDGAQSDEAPPQPTDTQKEESGKVEDDKPSPPNTNTENQPPRRINIKPASSALKKPEVTMEAWADQTIGGIFRITLDPNNTRDAHGRKLVFVEGVRKDLEEEEKPLRFTTDILDTAILEAASNRAVGRPLEYLLACWKRVSVLFRGMHNKQDPKYAIAKEARRLCFNYCIFAATMPDMFGEDSSTAVSPLVEYLLADPDSDRGLCHDFINEAVSRFSDDNGEEVKAALVSAMEALAGQLSKVSMNGDYKPYVLALRNFVRYPPLLLALVESPMFLPANIEAQQIETRTLLGPFFRLSPMQPEVALNYFSGPTTRDKANINNAQRSLRMILQTHQEELFEITNAFIRTSKESREKMLDWFALCVNKNHKRRAIQAVVKTLSSDGFMVNVTVTLDRLCEPFMDASFSKIDRIDIDYLRRSPRVDISDETKINADQHTSDEFYGTKAEGTNNFISEVFFLTVAAHHYGTEAANTNLSEMQRDVKWRQKRLDQLELERHKYLHNPGQLILFDNAVNKMKNQIEQTQCVVLAIQGVLLDEVTQARSMQFMRYVIVWLLRLVSGGTFPQKPLELPLPAEQPKAFQCLPEYFLEDIVDNFKFITRFIPHIITTTQCEELMMICITFLRSTEYIKNPYLKSGLVTILFHGVWPFGHRPKGVLGDVLFAHSFATKNLLHALMREYIECESAGTHTAFYDKFNIRYEIFQVIKCIWPNSVYRENLATEARVNLNFFVQFVNLLLNDVTYVLDESFTAFVQMHEISKILRNPPSNMTDETRKEHEEKLTAAQGRAKSYMQLTNETVAMLKLFTETLGDSFTKPEVVVRLAHMLDYNLDALVGPKSINLKVENPEEYGWNPKQMLAEITDVFINLQDKDSFIRAVATDGRSYKPENFTKAMEILRKHGLKSEVQLQEWRKLAQRIEKAKEEADVEEADLGEIPDEYADPLLATLMEDPVMLPASRTIIDRSTIQSHLLSDSHDPFNRMALKIEDVIPQPDLQKEIQAWKAERLSKRAAASQAGGEPMDTS
ncbi:hypothetical protein M011DRAFT_412649 [Sporormia fimetaria CBS 119925]|uniref:U-box domain-containing protein n=1 Tax=Sporormia fimetaria CBS 119925 TaxID=1340428 RepID=A0A6A6UYD8_9PLEO|nr:hypothetical protein M011DRAFT_412649 [Sporormia fimetaria CBS 119925]